MKRDLLAKFSRASNAGENLPRKSSQLKSNLQKNSASQLNFGRDSFSCEYSSCRLDQLVAVNLYFYLKLKFKTTCCTI